MNDKPGMILIEGGLGGHMSYMHEDPSLTFGEIKTIFRQLASRKNVISVVEKVDGQNIFFTFNIPAKQVRFARNKAHIASGGMSRADIVFKWASLPKVQAAFLEAYDVLQKVLVGLNKNVLRSVFGENGDVWFSAEVISSSNPNVLNYDGNHLVLHRAALQKNDVEGAIENVEAPAVYQSIVDLIGGEELENAKKNWAIHGPLMRSLLGVKDAKEFAKGFDILNFLQAKYGLQDSSTVADMVVEAVKNSMPEVANWPPQALRQLAAFENKIDERKFRIKNILAKEKISLGSTPSERNRVLTALIAKANNSAAKAMQNLGQALELLTEQVLRDLNSLLIANPTAETQRLRAELRKVEAEMHTSGLGSEAISKLEDRLQRLGGIDAIKNAIEGVVIRWKGKSYKLTYPFGLLNQILGLFRYGN